MARTSTLRKHGTSKRNDLPRNRGTAMNAPVLPRCLCASVVFLFSIWTPATAQLNDQRGDPLHGGAIARIGTARWRIAECPLHFTSDGRLAVADCAKPGLI